MTGASAGDPRNLPAGSTLLAPPLPVATDPPAESDPAGVGRVALAAPVLASVILSAVFIVRLSFRVGGRLYFSLFDDAMISMRYGRNLAEGHGLVWNAGVKPVEGYTNFLWTLWMAVIHLLPIPESMTSLAVMISGALLLAGTVVLAGRIADRLLTLSDRQPARATVVPVAMWLTAVFFPLVTWTLQGMEVGLLAFLYAAAVLLVMDIGEKSSGRRIALIALCLSLAVLTRPDALLPGLVIASYAVWQVRAESGRWALRPALVIGGVVIATFALHTLGRVWYYGDPLPNTYYLKVTGVTKSLRLQRGIGGLITVGTVELFAPLALAAAALAALGRRLHRAAWLLAGLFVAQCAYSVYVGGDTWESSEYASRYLSVAAPGLLVLAAIGIVTLLDPSRQGRVARRVGAGLGAAAIVLRFADLRPAMNLNFQLQVLPPDALWWRVGAPAVALVVVAAISLRGRHLAARRPMAMTLAALVVTGLTVVVGEGKNYGTWVSHNALSARFSESQARFGLALRAATAPSATVGFVAGGNPAYYSHRPGIDMLGKCDRHIAHAVPPDPPYFVPGHSKWDYAYVYRDLRPDVAQLWIATPDDVKRIQAWGYDPIAPALFVRRDSRLVNRDALAAAVAALH